MLIFCQNPSKQTKDMAKTASKKSLKCECPTSEDGSLYEIFIPVPDPFPECVITGC